jgi:S-adenosylmethionine-diacylgycerolhomoserine-N-methlytransferase
MRGGDVRVLLHLLRGQPRRGTLGERLQAFYGPQAAHYDAFRERLLHGRAELMKRLAPAPGATLVELGAGTGRNLDFLGGALDALDRVDLVDLCPALLELARARTRGHPNVRVMEGDAVTYRPDRPVDCVYFSYSLTMIPDWEGALRNALAMLRPGGRLGVVDFYVSGAAPEPGLVRHGALTRWFWPRWFGHDGVHPDPAHLATLRGLLPDHVLTEHRAPVPYLPGLRVPYYCFVGVATPDKATSGGYAGLGQARPQPFRSTTITRP